MPNDSDVRAIVQNLKDAGCDSEMVEQFLALGREAQIKKQLKLLEKHRKQLLDRVHEEEKRIDCLDYLTYQLNKKCHINK